MSHGSEVIETKGHHLVGVRWPVIGSKGDKYYVEMVNYGFECDCIAYAKCKHIKEVEKKITNECIFQFTFKEKYGIIIYKMEMRGIYNVK